MNREKRIGFIGMGNMAKAMAVGLIASGKVEPAALLAYAPHQEKLQRNAAEIGFKPCATVQDLVNGSDVVVLACKPYQAAAVCAEIRPLLDGKVLLSIANQWDFETCMAHVEDSTRVQYVMPNTPCQVGDGVFLLEAKNSLTTAERDWLKDLLAGCGTVFELPGHLLDAGSAVTGCGPAFVSMMMEAMADAAVQKGIPRQQAYEMVAQMVVGTGKLLRESGQHPGAMKDAVCSPGGTTIRGVIALEHAGMRAAFMDAIAAVTGE